MNENIAVVGCGHWGKNLVRNFSEMEALVAICDPNFELARRYADEFSVPALSFDEVIDSENVEGVVLAVPAPLHASMAIKALNSGKHVYVEKPLAMNDAEARAMIDCAVANDVQLMVGHLLHYHPVFRELKRLVKSGEFGDLQYIYSHRLSLGKVRSEEDVLWSFAPHDISMILSLVGAEPSAVRAESHSVLQPNISDVVTIHLEFSSDLNAHISVSWLHPEKEQKLVVIGERGMAVFDDTQSWPKKLALYSHRTEDFATSSQIVKGEKTFVALPEAEPLREECAHFLEVVRGGHNPITDGAEGLRVVRVLTAASRSLTNPKSQYEG